MARRPRLIVPDIPLHIIQRGNNRGNCFFSDSDYMAYLSMLRESAGVAGCKVHAYVLMTNHVHLLVTPASGQSAGKLMKYLGERYVQYINRRYGRAGTLWQGRYRSCLVQDEEYFMVCQRYIDLNPVRAAMVSNPGLYRWSSHRHYAFGDYNPFVTPHEVTLGLGLNSTSRQMAYRELCKQALPPKAIAELRDATNCNFTFGNERFAEQISALLGRPAFRRQGGLPVEC